MAMSRLKRTFGCDKIGSRTNAPSLFKSRLTSSVPRTEKIRVVPCNAISFLLCCFLAIRLLRDIETGAGPALFQTMKSPATSGLPSTPRTSRYNSILPDKITVSCLPLNWPGPDLLRHFGYFSITLSNHLNYRRKLTTPQHKNLVSQTYVRT